MVLKRHKNIFVRLTQYFKNFFLIQIYIFWFFLIRTVFEREISKVIYFSFIRNLT